MLTVVIPAYNVESYIGTCMRSVLDQIRPNSPVRIVVVVDGATDGTQECATITARQYPNCKVDFVIQANQGLSVARNNGIAISTTEYITFLDADDYWLPGYLDAVLTELYRWAPDVLEYDALMVDEFGKSLYEIKCASGKSNQTQQVSVSEFANNFRCFAWCRIYKTSLFKFRLFPAGRRFEDTATVPWLYWRAQNIVSLSKPLIAYRQRAGSILACPTASDIRDLGITSWEAADMFRETGDYYWRDVTLRVFQQTCSRIERLPVWQWADLIRTTKVGPIPLLPLPKSVIRRLQMRATWLYIGLLFAKRRTWDPLGALGRYLTHRNRREIFP